MPFQNPFQQKYSSQSHKNYNDNVVPAMPEGPKQDNDRRGSDSSISEASSPTGRRRVWIALVYTLHVLTLHSHPRRSGTPTYMP
jgi:hypothetical protein